MGNADGFGSALHLARRFFGALSPAGPPEDDERWARQSLNEGEQGLWSRMSGADRRHAVGVAREVVVLLGEDAATSEVIAAALLHDVGKIESGLGTFSRVGVTVAALAAGRTRLVKQGASAAPGSVRSRIGQYLEHDRIGAELLAAAGSSTLTVSWAGEHHLPASSWSLDRRVADALKTADGD